MTTSQVQIIVIVQSQVLPTNKSHTILELHRDNSLIIRKKWNVAIKYSITSAMKIHSRYTASYNQYMRTLPCKVI